MEFSITIQKFKKKCAFCHLLLRLGACYEYYLKRWKSHCSFHWEEEIDGRSREKMRRLNAEKERGDDWRGRQKGTERREHQEDEEGEVQQLQIQGTLEKLRNILMLKVKQCNWLSHCNYLKPRQELWLMYSSVSVYLVKGLRGGRENLSIFQSHFHAVSPVCQTEQPVSDLQKGCLLQDKALSCCSSTGNSSMYESKNLAAHQQKLQTHLHVLLHQVRSLMKQHA